MLNKGLKLLYCKECKRKRYCSIISISNYNFRKSCSKGHSWIIEGIALERINAATQDTLNPDKLKALFDRDNPFYRALKK